MVKSIHYLSLYGQHKLHLIVDTVKTWAERQRYKATREFKSVSTF